MNELIAQYWPWLLAALLLGLVVAWAVLRGTRRTRVSGTARDVLDEGADRAQRNAALIDAPPAADPATLAAAAPPGLGGTGVVVAAATDTATMAAAAATAAPEDAPSAELMRLKGVGPKLAARLDELGVHSLEQIAALDDAGIDRLDEQLGRFRGRIRQDDWPNQARLLLAGDDEAYRRTYGAGT